MFHADYPEVVVERARERGLQRVVVENKDGSLTWAMHAVDIFFVSKGR